MPVASTGHRSGHLRPVELCSLMSSHDSFRRGPSSAGVRTRRMPRLWSRSRHLRFTAPAKAGSSMIGRLNGFASTTSSFEIIFVLQTTYDTARFLFPAVGEDLKYPGANTPQQHVRIVGADVRRHSADASFRGELSLVTSDPTNVVVFQRAVSGSWPAGSPGFYT